MGHAETEKAREEDEVKNLVTTDLLNFIPGVGFAMDAIDAVGGVYDGLAGDTARERSDGWAQAQMGALGMIPGVGLAMDIAQLSHDVGRANVYDETGVVEPSFEEDWANQEWESEQRKYRANAPALAKKHPAWQPGHNEADQQTDAPAEEGEWQPGDNNVDQQCDPPAEEGEWQPGHNNPDQQCDVPEQMLFYGMY